MNEYMQLENIDFTIDIEFKSRLLIGLRRAFELAQELFERKSKDKIDLSKKEKIGMYVSTLRTDNFYWLQPENYTDDKYSYEENKNIKEAVRAIRKSLLNTENWEDVGVFKRRNHSIMVEKAIQHWASHALQEATAEQMNVDAEMTNMKNSLVQMDAALKDVNKINNTANDVVKDLLKIAESLEGKTYV